MATVNDCAAMEEKVTLSQPTSRRVTTELASLPQAFVERQHELTTLSTRLRNDLAVQLSDRLKYAFELKNYHLLGQEELAGVLETNLLTGLSAQVAAHRLATDGPNIITPPKQLPLWARFVKCFFTGFAPLLWVAAFFVFLSWKPFGVPPTDVYSLCLAVVLLAVIVIAGLFTFHQEVRSANALSSFGSLLPPACLVIRDGQASRINAQDLVVGDVVKIGAGDVVPSDMRVCVASGLRVDQSLLTGESEPCKVTVLPASDKTISLLQASNVVFTGSNVMEGEGVGLVMTTGKDNQLSKIAISASGAAGPTSLQAEIDRFVKVIAALAFTTGAIVIAWWGLFLSRKHPGFMTTGSMIANAISVIVAYIPEGLPLALSMGLAIIARRLCYTHKVLVKRLGTVETLGSMSLLCSDKTGTLTQNRMTVTSIISATTPTTNEVLDENTTTAEVNAVSMEDVNRAIAVQKTLGYEALLRVAVCCNQSKLQAANAQDTGRSRSPTEDNMSEDGHDDVEVGVSPDKELCVVGGNGIDRALLTWVHSLGYAKDIHDKYVQEAIIPFSSTTKMTTVVVREKHNTDTSIDSHVVLVKGAPEYVISRCKYMYTHSAENTQNEEEQESTYTLMTDAQRKSIFDAISLAGGQGYRVVALAERTRMPTVPADFVYEVEPPNFPTDALTFVACVAVSDPPRIGVQKAVMDMRKAGIKIAMLTGDAANTATAIARQVGIVSTQHMNNVTAYTKHNTADTHQESGPPPFTVMEFMDKNTSAKTHKTDSTRDDIVVSKSHISTHPHAHTKDSIVSECKAVLVTGPELDTLSAQGWDYVFTHAEIVFARTTPEQKLQIVREAQARGDRVGVTGDGVNDSPALKNADVGIGMASGSSVAREAADIVLLDDNFVSIPQGVKEGRLIFANLRKVIAYQISAGCWSELLPVLATFFLGMPQPLSSFLMIIISCLTDVFAGVALMREPPEQSIMLQPPRNIHTSRLVDAKLVGYSYLFFANIISAGAFLNYFAYMRSRGPTHSTDVFPAGYAPSQLVFAWTWGTTGDALAHDQQAATNTASAVFFIAILVGQMGHLLSIRIKAPYFYEIFTNTENSFKNKVIEAIKSIQVRERIIYAWAGALFVAVLITEVPALQQLCGTGAVPAVNWGIAAGWSTLSFMLAEGRKWLIHVYPHSIAAKSAW